MRAAAFLLVIPFAFAPLARMSAVDIRDKKVTCLVLEMILKHTADVFETLVEIVAEKYDIERDEMFAVITKHPKWKGMVVDPALHALTAEPAAPAEPAPEPAPAELAPELAPEPGPVAAKPKRQWSEEAKAAAAAKRAARKAEAAPAAPTEPEPTPSEATLPEPTQPPPSTEPKVVRKFVIKPKSKPAEA